jgi:hypothetical protein
LLAGRALQEWGVRSIALRSQRGAWPRVEPAQFDWLAADPVKLCGDSTALHAVTARKATMAYSAAVAALRLLHRPFSRRPKASVQAKWVIQPAA